MLLTSRKLNSLPCGLIPVLLNIAVIIQLHMASATTQLDPIPMPCDSIKCPPDAEMQCPADSAVREYREVNAVDLIKSNAVDSHDENSLAASLVATESSVYINDSLVDEVLFAQCCLSKKCICSTCQIPGCNGTDVVIELESESMDTPGQCCGQYECQPEPDCTEIKNTDYYWLTNCQRCLCISGARICEQKCDDTKADKAKAICKSNNNYYEDGNRWVDGCYQCECNKTEVKCWSSFCVSLNCPSDRQVHLTGSCCPVCWPKDHPMPNEKSGNYDEGYGYEFPPKQGEIDATDIAATSSTTTSTSTSTSTSTTTSTTERPEMIAKIDNNFKESTTNAPPCQMHDSSNEVAVHPLNGFKDPHLYHIIIVVLACIIGVLIFYIRHLHAKQRSYRPVSNFDDKV